MGDESRQRAMGDGGRVEVRRERLWGRKVGRMEAGDRRWESDAGVAGELLMGTGVLGTGVDMVMKMEYFFMKYGSTGRHRNGKSSNKGNSGRALQ